MPQIQLDRDFYYRFLYALDDLQVFSLSMDLERLSLYDEVSSPSTVSGPVALPRRYSYPPFSFSHFPHPNNWQHSFIETLRSPFVELPPEFLDSLHSYGLKMGLGFRFTPGQQNFIIQELRLPQMDEKLQLMSRSLGLSYYTAPLRPCAMPLHGMKELVDLSPGKVLVEVITEYSGKYGLILVLISLGIGCTAWFSFVPIDVDPPFAPIESYSPFYNLDYVAPGFNRLNFVEVQNVTETVGAIFEKEAPFTDLVIPASGPTLRAVGLGIMIGFFLAVGIVPDCTSSLVSSGLSPDCLNLLPLVFPHSPLLPKVSNLLRSYVSSNEPSVSGQEKRTEFLGAISRVYATVSQYPGYPLVDSEVEDLKISILLRDYSLSPRKIVLFDEKEKDLFWLHYSSSILLKDISGLPFNVCYYHNPKDELVLMALGGFLNITLNASKFYHPYSYAFRNDRGIEDLHLEMKSWCVNRPISSLLYVDIYGHMSYISHPHLLGLLKSCFKEEYLYGLIESFLSLPIILKSGESWSPTEGLIPFTFLTPVLFNLSLNSLDIAFASRFPGFKYARYDGYVFIPIYSDQSMDVLPEFFEEQGLTCSMSFLKAGDTVECPGGLLSLSMEGSLYIVNSEDSEVK